MKKVIIIIICLGFISCGNNKTEIIQLSNLTKIYHFQNEKVEYFVVANPPQNSDTLLNLLSSHFQVFAPNDTIEKYYYYSHFYFKETRFTPRDYKEEWKGYFNHDYIDNHYKDLLIRIMIKPEFNRQTIYFYKKGKIEQKIETKWKSLK